MLLLLVWAMSLSDSIAQVIFHKKVNIGAIALLWSEEKPENFNTILQDNLKGCWRQTELRMEGLSFGRAIPEKGLKTFVPEAFPIPATGPIPIRIPELEGESRVLILSLEGRVLHRQKLYTLETWLNIEMLSRGYYIVRYEGRNHSWRLPLIKR